MEKDFLLRALPYGSGFRFVDEITRVDRDGIEGSYRFDASAPWYNDHIPGAPLTPGVILIECMAQIGLVCLGLYLLELEEPGFLRRADKCQEMPFAFSESHVLFDAPVPPGTCVRVKSEKTYWRLGKLKCQVEMQDQKGQQLASGQLSGMRLRLPSAR